MVPAAIVFDFDGVIANTEPLHLRAFQQVLADAGVDLTAEEYYSRYLGYDDTAMVEQIAIDRGFELSADERHALLQRKATLMPLLLRSPDVLFEGAAECVRRLAAATPLAIASGALRSEIELVLDAGGLRNCFACIVAAGETREGKPAPDPYQRVIELLAGAGLVAAHDGASRRSVAIEDSHWGIVSARAAGLWCVAVATSYPAEQLTDADLVFPSLDAVRLEALSALVAGR
jgi:beta-phosphoglucomutase-like phosphatase (HAD superfamily)